MNYTGSKHKMSKFLLPFIYKELENKDTYVEPFVGGSNMIKFVKTKKRKIGSDINHYIISLSKKIQLGWIPEKYTKEEYKLVKENKDKYEEHIVGWLGVALSFKGMWFGGFTHTQFNSDGSIYIDYQAQQLRCLERDRVKISDVEYFHSDYKNLTIPNNSLIYCDPPYKNTSQPYVKNKNFNYEEFYDWCRDKRDSGHTILVSEFEMPSDFECIYTKNRNMLGGSGKIKQEKLFILK